MRVISGIARGMKLQTPLGFNTRPTTDRIKESLFNIIQNDLFEVNFLDLFSGSGAIGIEALSRGARKTVFIDNSEESIEIINKNLEHTKLISKAEVIKSNIANGLRILNDKFDIIFMDPPYEDNTISLILNIIKEDRLLKKDGFIIIERAIKDENPSIPGLEIFRIKEYKTTKIIFLEYTEGYYG